MDESDDNLPKVMTRCGKKDLHTCPMCRGRIYWIDPKATPVKTEKRKCPHCGVLLRVELKSALLHIVVSLVGIVLTFLGLKLGTLEFTVAGMLLSAVGLLIQVLGHRTEVTLVHARDYRRPDPATLDTVRETR